MTASGDLMLEVDVTAVGPYAAAPGSRYNRSGREDHCELTWVTEGASLLECSGRTHELRPGTVILTRPGSPATYLWGEDALSRGHFIFFTTHGGIDAGWPAVRHLSDDDIVISLFKHVNWLDGTRPDFWDLQVRQALSYALLAFHTGFSATGDRSRPYFSEPIERSMNLVRVRWASGGPFQPPALKELAEAAGVTKEHLCRVYKKEIGYGPASALRLLRLRHAASLLVRTPLPVARIAAEAGFESQFHFSRTFKTQFGASPTEFRQEGSPHVPLPDSVRHLGLYL